MICPFPYTTKKLHQRLIITYSPKYALYQKMIRDKQVERAQKMIDSGSTKQNRKNPNDPARFIGTIAATKDGEAAHVHSYLDTDKIKADRRMFPNHENRFFCKASLPAGRKPD